MAAKIDDAIAKFQKIDAGEGAEAHSFFSFFSGGFGLAQVGANPRENGAGIPSHPHIAAGSPREPSCSAWGDS
eukprot:5963119-Pyramimonas_sp.AAC.1